MNQQIIQNSVFDLLNLAWANGCLALVELLNVECTCRHLGRRIREECRLKIKMNSQYTYEHDIIVQSMAAVINMSSDFINMVVEKIFQNQCFLSGSTLLTSISGHPSYEGADVDIYVNYPTEHVEQRSFLIRIKNLIQIMSEENFELQIDEDDLPMKADKVIGFIETGFQHEHEHCQRMNEEEKDIFTYGTYDSRNLIFIMSFTR